MQFGTREFSIHILSDAARFVPDRLRQTMHVVCLSIGRLCVKGAVNVRSSSSTSFSVHEYLFTFI